MMLVRYQGQVAGFVGATRYGLAPELAARPADDVDRRPGLRQFMGIRGRFRHGIARVFGVRGSLNGVSA